MFGIDLTILAFVGLATLAVGGLVYALLFDRVTNEVRQEKRVKSVQVRKEENRTKAAARVADAAKRKKSVQDSLKELEAKQRERSKSNVGLKRQMQQAGLKLTIRHFILISLATGIIAVAIAVTLGAPPLGSLAAGIVGGFGIPRWMVARIHKRRMNKFLEEFPNAVDV
ncbi:MAG TPA: pilus assembly protein, partial [Rhizobiaceae bacterium]|nr:pilus assembly protein [Rhizobiaceae bacterium]